MNKAEFIDYIAQEHDCSKAKAEEIINVFTSSVTSALGGGKDVVLIGFGKFYTNYVAAKIGRNPKTGAELKISERTAPKFSAGEKLKVACNKKK